MNIVVPMAGLGSRFANRGINVPKPLISVAGLPMVAWALKSLEEIEYKKIIFIILHEHDKHFGVSKMLKNLKQGAVEVIVINHVTEGQLCTVLAAKDLINEDDDLLITSSDTYVISSLGKDINQKPTSCAGIISVADLPGDRWSFARTDLNGRVIQVSEKVRISNNASTGMYYFSNGHDFVMMSEEMVQNGEKTRGEYYVMPLYQKYINQGREIRLSYANQVWDMGNPEALRFFLENFREG